MFAYQKKHATKFYPLEILRKIPKVIKQELINISMSTYQKIPFEIFA
jgi:hypothetical protein